MLTRIFQSGNSLAVRIPKELAFADGVQEVEIARVGNTLVLQPIAKETIGDLSEVFGAFPRSFMREGRAFHTQSERDWGGSLPEVAPRKTHARSVKPKP